MATETMTLYPILVDSPDTSLISLSPTSVNIDSAAILINEAVADDDAGCITIAAGGQINSYFNYKRPSNMLDITGVSIKIRCKLETSKNNKVLNNTFTITSDFTPTNVSGITTDYADYELAFSDLSAIVGELNSITDKQLCLASNVSSGTKYSPIKITQISIIVTYNTIAETVYQKINNTWTEITNPQFYKFSNNTWQTGTTSDFLDGQKYILKSI